MNTTRRWTCAGLSAWGLTWGLALACGGARAADVVSVTIAASESEVISKDLKRLRLAEDATINFEVKTTYLEQVFKNDLSIPTSLMRASAIASIRAALGPRTADEIVSGKATDAVIDHLNRSVAHLGVAVRDHTMRFALQGL